jgi:hypothetical protein
MRPIARGRREHGSKSKIRRHQQPPALLTGRFSQKEKKGPGDGDGPALTTACFLGPLKGKGDPRDC